MFLSGTLPSVAFLLALLRALETPRFLLQSGQKREGRSLLARIINEEEATIQAAEIEANLINTFTRIPRDRKALRRVLAVSFVLAILIHVSGINTIIDYAPLILKSAGWKIDAALFSTFVIGGVNCLFTLISFWTIDRCGRRPLYIIGSLGMATSLFLLIGALTFSGGNAILILSFIGLFIAFFASCIGPTFWTLIPEIFPNNIRGKAMVVPVVT